MQIKLLYLGELQTNCYLIINEETRETIIIDPASDKDNRIINMVEREGLKPQAILLTHGHFDHIGSVDSLKEQYHIPVYASEAERKMMSDSQLNLSEAFIYKTITAQADQVIKDCDKLSIGLFEFECIEVPGHTTESICYYMPSEQVLFSGDTLFKESIGRPDFFEGPFDTLAKSIKSRLFNLPGETVVYPGHGFSTTIEDEKKHNLFLK